MLSRSNDEERVIHFKSDNIEIMTNNKANELIEELFQSLLSRYQIGLETSMKCNDFILDSVHILYQRCHKINFRYDRSYINCPDLIKSKKAKVYPINKNDNVFNMLQQLP